MTETTVFQSGNSQAVRLPKEFRFNSKTVEIFRRGDEIVLREKPRTMADVLRSLPPVTAQTGEDIEAMFAAAKEPLPPDTRDWDALWGPYAQPAPATATGPVRAKKAPARTRSKSK